MAPIITFPVAADYGTSWSDLQRHHGYPEVFDHGNSPAVFGFLSRLTSVPLAKIRTLDLAIRFPGQKLSRFSCHPRDRRAVADWCSACFDDDIVAGRDNYLQYRWAIGGIGHCHKHRRMLDIICSKCFRDFEMQYGIVAGALRACCSGCKEPFRSFDRLPRRLDSLLKDERRVLKVLHEAAHGEPWLGVIGDVSFLLFCKDSTRFSGTIKERLRRWDDDGPSGMITPALERANVIHDGSFLFPLATTVPRKRSELFAVARAIIDFETTGRPQAYAFKDFVPRTLVSLFAQLNDAEREELTWRADRWPQALRNRVRGIIHSPLTNSRRSRLLDREPWAGGYRRRRANDGRIPRYKYL